MQVVRINKAVCTFNGLMHGESEKLRKEVRSKFSYPERGGHFVQPPLVRMKGTSSRLGNLHLDTELLLRYTKMSFPARRALIRSIWRTLDKADVDLLETDIPWGDTTTRDIVVTRYTIENSRTFTLWLTMPRK